MRRAVYVLELTDDEAELVVAAVSSTPVRFGGMPLSKPLALAQEVMANIPDGSTSVHQVVVSDGVRYLGLRPVKAAGMLD